MEEDGASELSGFASADLVGELTRRTQCFTGQESKIEEMERRICAFAAGPKEVLDINAGGQIHSVKRETLLLAKGSVLAAMFSGNGDNVLARDSQGRPFLDINPYIFDKVVNYLRQKLIEGPDSPAPLPVIDPARACEYKRVITDFGLTELLYDDTTVNVQSLSREGSIHIISDSFPRGYGIRLSRPIRLKAVLVGLTPGNYRGNLVMIGYMKSSEEWTVSHEAPLEVFNRASSEWTVSEQLTQCADFPDLILYPPEVYVMVQAPSKSLESVVGDSAVRGAGPFQVVSKFGEPPMVNTCNPVMSLVYTNVVE